MRGNEYLQFDDGLKHLGLTCLDRRKSRSYLVVNCKIMSGMYDIRNKYVLA